MHPVLYWIFSVLPGAGAAAVAWEFAGWRLAAVGLGSVYVLGFGLLFRVHYALRSRISSWKRPSLSSGAFSGLVSLTALLVLHVSEAPGGEPLALALAVFGAGIVGLAAGTGIALENVDQIARDSRDEDPRAASSDG